MKSGLEKYVEQTVEKSKETKIGYIVSEPYQLHIGSQSVAPIGHVEPADSWIWVVDVEIDEEVVKACQIATNNRDIFYADIGKAVQVMKIQGRWVVVGLARVKKGWKKIVCLNFTEEGYTYGEEYLEGRAYRRLTYTELGSIPGKYGIFPYGAIGVFDAYGNFIELLTKPGA